jgi:uncharacterized membrane protein
MMIAVLLAILVLLSLFVGGNKTAKSMVTLGINGIILVLAIAALFFGVHPLMVTAVTCLGVTFVTVFFQNEINEKSKAALISVILVTAIMIGLIAVFVYQGHLQGMPVVGQNEIRASNGYAADIGRNMALIQVFVMIMALVGAVIDTAIAITSGTYEVVKHNPDLDRKSIMGSAMKIGRDVLSSTVNTLFFIFAGESLILFINFVNYYSFPAMINAKEFAQAGIIMAISGVGCVIVIPVAAALGALRFYKK